jgi:hypothetical protein
MKKVRFWGLGLQAETLAAAIGIMAYGPEPERSTVRFPIAARSQTDPHDRSATLKAARSGGNSLAPK